MTVGVILIILSIYMWYASVINDNVDKYISNGKLLTTGYIFCFYYFCIRIDFNSK